MVRNSSSSQSSRSNLLLDQLQKAGLLTKDQIDVILFDHAATSFPIREIMLQRGWLKEQTISYFMESIAPQEKKLPPTQSLEQQISQLRQQQKKLRKVKIALEQEIENLRKEKDVLRRYSTRQPRKNLNAVDTTKQSTQRRTDADSGRMSSTDSINWIG